MKKMFSAVGYVFLSLILFLAGTSIDVPRGDFSLDDLKPDAFFEQEEKQRKDTDEDADKESEHETDYHASKYYYSLLDESDKAYYRQIEEAMENEEVSATLTGIDKDMLNTVYTSVLMDRPDLFWCENSYTYVTSDSGMKIAFNYNCTGEEREKRQKVIEKQIGEFCAQMPDGDDYEKIKYVFETLVKKTEYNWDAEDNQNIYSVFGNWETVCAGYAKATQILLQTAGVECIYVVGDAGTERHAWNIVNCNGIYCCVDTTWGDPIYAKEQGVDVPADNIAYEYLCCAAQSMEKHVPDAEFLLPECNDVSYEYFRRQGRYLESADKTALLDIMKQDIDAGKKQTEVQFANREDYQQVLAQLQEEILREAMDYYVSKTGESASDCRYWYSDGTKKLTFTWKK